MPDLDLIAHRDETVERIRAELLLLIHESGRTQRQLEETNGFRPRYLSQVLQGRITLTARHILGILLALDVDPTELFERLAGPRYPTGKQYAEIRERLARYDAAIDELERRGLVSRRPEEESEES